MLRMFHERDQWRRAGSSDLPLQADRRLALIFTCVVLHEFVA